MCRQNLHRRPHVFRSNCHCIWSVSMSLLRIWQPRSRSVLTLITGYAYFAPSIIKTYGYDRMWIPALTILRRLIDFPSHYDPVILDSTVGSCMGLFHADRCPFRQNWTSLCVYYRTHADCDGWVWYLVECAWGRESRSSVRCFIPGHQRLLQCHAGDSVLVRYEPGRPSPTKHRNCVASGLRKQ